MHRFVFFSQLFGDPVEHRLCWDCYANVMRLLREQQGQRP